MQQSLESLFQPLTQALFTDSKSVQDYIQASSAEDLGRIIATLEADKEGCHKYLYCSLSADLAPIVSAIKETISEVIQLPGLEGFYEKCKKQLELLKNGKSSELTFKEEAVSILTATIHELTARFLKHLCAELYPEKQFNFTAEKVKQHPELIKRLWDSTNRLIDHMVRKLFDITQDQYRLPPALVQCHALRLCSLCMLKTAGTQEELNQRVEAFISNHGALWLAASVGEERPLYPLKDAIIGSIPLSFCSILEQTLTAVEKGLYDQQHPFAKALHSAVELTDKMQKITSALTELEKAKKEQQDKEKQRCEQEQAAASRLGLSRTASWRSLSQPFSQTPQKSSSLP